MNKVFLASLDKLFEMLNFIRYHAKTSGFQQPQLSKIELASEEILVNIISYGYENGNGIIDIECNYLNEKSGLEIIFKDEGIPFNPLEKVININFTEPLEKKQPGGYGIFFVIEIMDDVSYKRENNYNILKLKKYL